VHVLREIELTALTPAIRVERGIGSQHGALVFLVSVRVAAEIRIRSGVVIVQVNRAPIASADDAARALDYYGGRGPVRILVERNRQLLATEPFVVR